jgi:hypothetical protein
MAPGDVYAIFTGGAYDRGIMRILPSFIAALWLLSLLVAGAHAEPAPPPPVGPIGTNRPTQGTNTGVVGPGIVQLETGANLTVYKGGGPILQQFQAQLRIGLGQNTEIDFTNPLYNGMSGQTGLGDTNVAFKWQVADWKTSDGTAVFALVPNVTLRTGADAFRNPGTIGQLIFSADVPVGKSGQTLTLNLAPTSLVDGAQGRRFFQVFSAAYYTFPVNATTSSWVEVSAIGPDRSAGGVFLPSVDAGMAFLVGKAPQDWQIDFDVLKGLGSRGTDWFLTIGLSHRFR